MLGDHEVLVRLDNALLIGTTVISSNRVSVRRIEIHAIEAVLVVNWKAGGLEHLDVTVQVAPLPTVLLGKRLQCQATTGLRKRTLQNFQTNGAIASGHSGADCIPVWNGAIRYLAPRMDDERSERYSAGNGIYGK